MDPIQKYTDLTYGFLLLVGLVLIKVFPAHDMLVGFGVGLFIGYVVHVGSQMISFDRMLKSFEEKTETMEKTAQTMEEKTEVMEKTAQSMEEKVESVEKKLNGDG